VILIQNYTKSKNENFVFIKNKIMSHLGNSRTDYRIDYLNISRKYSNDDTQRVYYLEKAEP